MRIALLISGGGTTAERIIMAARSGDLPGVQPALVIASRTDAPGIDRAIRAGVSKENVVILSPDDFPDAEMFGDTIIAACTARGIEFIGQYGWMVKTPTNVIERFPGMMVNQHPGPLDPGRPDFGGPGMYGRRVHAARLNFVRATQRDFWTEATAQRVAPRFDEGAVLKRKTVPILSGDDAVALQERVLPAEHEVQVETLRDFASGNVRELVRQESLVRHGEEKILEEAKKVAIKLFPNG